jgi:PAS domain S-box-containing protein
MHEIARVTLENEMDLILAHKRSMKLAEISGLSLSAQTTFATAVSEVSRTTIETGKQGCLVLSVDIEQRDKYIVACMINENKIDDRAREGLEYARKLVNKYNISTKGSQTSIELYYYISPSFRIDIIKLDEWRQLFRNEPPISPYEELKRKNEQLQDLSEKVQKSEDRYKVLTNALPLIIFSLNPQGELIYANEWLTRFSGETVESLNRRKWKNVIHEEDYHSFALLLKNGITSDAVTVKTQTRIKSKKTGEYFWHQVSLSPLKNDSGELQYWIGYIVDIHAQKVYEQTLMDNIELKQTQEQLKENQLMLEKYIDELNRSNRELTQFAFIASHDLQEPVRKLLFYSDYLLQKYTGNIDGKGVEYLKNMHGASQRMRNLIQDLLLFSQIHREKMEFRDTDLNVIAREMHQDLEMTIDEKKAMLTIDTLPTIQADEVMMRQLFTNIIGNSLKYSKPAQPPRISVTNREVDGFLEIAFEDNGIGFDEKYNSQIFTLFQRLHTRDLYEGTGLGLAICRKIVELHNGKIRAEAKEGLGATFYVSLPLKSR